MEKEKLYKTISELNDWLKMNDLNFEQWIQFINSDYSWASWCMNRYKNELVNYTILRSIELDMLIYSIIKVSDKELAEELYLRIKKNESTFKELAYKLSEGIEKYTNGFWSYFN